MTCWMRLWCICLLACLALPAYGQKTVQYFHTDALGSVVAVTGATGALIERREYEPYGAQLTPAVQDGPGYTGHVQDAVTGLVYMQQRYYDPLIGRFLSVDPVTTNSSTGANFNRYWYANNNPNKFVDPDGRFGCAASRIKSVCIGGGATALRTSVRSPRDTGDLSRVAATNPTPNVKLRPGKVLSDPFLGNDLQALSDSVGGKDIDVISGYRSQREQDRERAAGNVRAAKSSQHTKGRAADIKIEGMSQADVGKAAFDLGRFERVNVYDSPDAGVHVDYLDMGPGTHMYQQWNRVPRP